MSDCPLLPNHFAGRWQTATDEGTPLLDPVNRYASWCAWAARAWTWPRASLSPAHRVATLCAP